MSNLIPTPIVDKNGVASTRHKKQVTHTDASSIPAPNLSMKAMSSDSSAEIGGGNSAGGNFFTRWQDRRRQKKTVEADAAKRMKLRDELLGILYLNKGDFFAGSDLENVRSSVDKNLSTGEIEMVLDLAKLFTRDGVSSEDAEKDRKCLVWSLADSVLNKNVSAQIRAMSAHSDWFREHPGEAEKLRNTINALSRLDMIPNGGNDGIQHMDAYMAAALHVEYDSYGIYAIWRKDYMNAAVRYPEQIDDIVTYIVARQGFAEDGFDEFMAAAAKHPDRVEKMKDYMAERGTFDEAGFDEYDNAALPLADGAL